MIFKSARMTQTQTFIRYIFKNHCKLVKKNGGKIVKPVNGRPQNKGIFTGTHKQPPAVFRVIQSVEKSFDLIGGYIHPQMLCRIILQRLPFIKHNSGVIGKRRTFQFFNGTDLQIHKKEGMIGHKHIRLVPFFSCIPIKTGTEKAAGGAVAGGTFTAYKIPYIALHGKWKITIETCRGGV